MRKDVTWSARKVRGEWTRGTWFDFQAALRLHLRFMVMTTK